MIQIYHNNRCGKSRACLTFIEQTGKEYKIITYLEDVPTLGELSDILRKLQMEPIELVRQKEKVWIENYKDKTMTDEEIIHAMILHPILIERPIVVNGEKAIVARPLERAASII